MSTWKRLLQVLLTLLPVTLLAACSGELPSDGSEQQEGAEENVGSVSQATTQSCSTPPATGECRYAPIAAYASSIESGAHSADRAIDGDCGSRWSSSFSDPQWLKVDLGSKRALSRVVVRWEAAASADYTLQVSDNAVDWTTVANDENASISGTGNNRIDTLSGLSASARYVRVHSTRRSTSYGNSIFELEVFGTDCGITPGCSQIPVFPVSAAASSIEHSGKPASNAIDGLSSTRWSSLASNPQWLRLDLGTSQDVTRVAIDWEAAASAAYEIQVSDSTAGPWTVVHSRVDNRQGPRTDDIAKLTAKGRYLRIYSTKRTSNFGISIFEIRLYRESCKECEQLLTPTGSAASSTESSAYAASKAVDGDFGTRWGSAFSDPQWLRLDFGQSRKFRQVMLKWEAAASKSYRLEVSASANGPWEVLAQKSNQPAGPRLDVISDLKAVGRYLRIYSTQRTGTYGNSIYEVITLGSASPTSFCDCPLGDSDLDGASDCEDACPRDPAKKVPGECGCNIPELDEDQDNIIDCKDGCKNDPTNTQCSNDDLVPGPVNLPDPRPETPVNQALCNQTTGVPEPTSIYPGVPSQADKAAMRASLQLMANKDFAQPKACEDVQALTDCGLDPNNVTTVECPFDSPEGDAWCGSGYLCGFGTPTACKNPNANLPESICRTKQLFCGHPDPNCTAPEGVPVPAPTDDCSQGNCFCANPGDPNCGCTQYDICSPPDHTGGKRNPTDPTVYDKTSVPPAAEITSKHQPAEKVVYEDPVNSPTCPAPHDGDCWCKLSLGEPRPTIHDGQTKNGNHGDGSIIEVNFDPNLTFDANVNPLAFGETNFNVDAAATLKSSIRIDLPLFDPEEIELLEFSAGVSAARCDINTMDTKFEVFGVDFVDLSDAGSKPFSASGSSSSALSQAAAACSKAVTAYTEATDRAKKALKDAQMLIEKYKTLPVSKSFIKEDFCDSVHSGEDGFVNGDCENETVAKTLNRYVDYYNTVKIDAVKSAMLGLTQASADLVGAFQANDIDSTINFLHVDRHESETIFSAQFFVGPIPVNISVDAGLLYGIEGNLFYRFSPFSALAAPVGASGSQLAAVGGKLVPRAGATLEIFAGAGFDVPGFAVKAGIAGNLTLASIAANIEAGAGLSVRTMEDKRPIPAPLDTLGENEHIFPPRQYEFYLDYFYGASLNVYDVLKGTINAKVKLKALFFSKTFQKTIVTFNSPFDPINARLLEGGGQLANITLPAIAIPANALGTFQQQIPLVKLKRLLDTTPDPIGTETFDPETLPSTLHYDGYCDQDPVK